MRLTPQEMKKYEQALERQRKEIWEKSKKIVIRRHGIILPHFIKGQVIGNVTGGV